MFITTQVAISSRIEQQMLHLYLTRWPSPLSFTKQPTPQHTNLPVEQLIKLHHTAGSRQCIIPSWMQQDTCLVHASLVPHHATLCLIHQAAKP
jgi:hypothetical protein